MGDDRNYQVCDHLPFLACNYKNLERILRLQSLSDLVDQSFGIFPSQTWVGDGFAVAVFSDLLAAWFDIAFYHDTFDHLVDLAGMAAAVEDFLDNTDLLHVLFAGVGVVGIHDAGRICQIPFGVKLMKVNQATR